MRIPMIYVLRRLGISLAIIGVLLSLSATSFAQGNAGPGTTPTAISGGSGGAVTTTGGVTGGAGTAGGTSNTGGTNFTSSTSPTGGNSAGGTDNAGGAGTNIGGSSINGTTTPGDTTVSTTGSSGQSGTATNQSAGAGPNIWLTVIGVLVLLVVIGTVLARFLTRSGAARSEGQRG